jgi:uncharacterized protein
VYFPYKNTAKNMALYYGWRMSESQFVWDDKKNQANLKKHHVSFEMAQFAFLDSNRVIARDLSHSEAEERFFCFGKIDGGVLTVRFT